MKDRKEDWYLPWVVRPESFRTHVPGGANRSGPLSLPGGGDSSFSAGQSSFSSAQSNFTGGHNSLSGGHSNFCSGQNIFSGSSGQTSLSTKSSPNRNTSSVRESVGFAFRKGTFSSSGDLLASLVASSKAVASIRKDYSHSVGLHDALLKCNRETPLGSDFDCLSSPPKSLPPRRGESPLTSLKFQRKLNCAGEQSLNKTADEEKCKDSSLSTPDGILRSCESLDNIFDKWEKPKGVDGSERGLSLSASNAKSLPLIDHLSDDEDDSEVGNSVLSSSSLYTNPFLSNEHPITGHRHHSSHATKTAQPKRVVKKKKTNLKRRHATRDKDGRSKSLTQIDSLVDSSGDMLLLGSQGDSNPEEKGANKLVVPDEHSGRKPPRLSMENRVSSGEFVTLVMETGKETTEDVILATTGVSLREAVESRGLDISFVELHQEGLRTPVPSYTDLSQLGGKCIHVKGRDDTKSPSRHRSSAQIPKKSAAGRFWGGGSTEEYSPLVEDKGCVGPSGHEGSLKSSKGKANNRWSLFQSNSKDSKMEDLVRQLDQYSRSGIPRLPHLITCQSFADEYEVKLEESWRTIVTSSNSLNEREEKQQSAIWELVETEATYIGMLKVITDLFLACLCNLQAENILNEIDTEKLFNNIQDVYEASLRFWRDFVYPVLEEARRTRRPLDPTLLLEGFCKFEEIFEPYTQYCLEQTNCQLYCKENARENNYFKAYLAWCETQRECNRLKLVDILVHPMQRITRYSMLLKAILKKTDGEANKTCLQEMILHVDYFVSTVNTALRNRDELERMTEITKRIDAYDAVEARDDELTAAVRLHSDLNLLQAMPGCPSHIQRWLLFQGDFRLRDTHTSKTDIHLFLFTDFLLLTKITQRKAEKVKIIRPPYRVDHLVHIELKDPQVLGLIHVTDWGVAAAAFTLQSSDSKLNKSFLEALTTARKQFHDARHFRERTIMEAPEIDHSCAPSRSPRIGSSRASRVSSLVHSHSGSIELNEASSYASPGGHHPPSVDLSEIRGSSASSDDSMSSNQAEIQRSKSLEGQHSAHSRPERRLAFPKSPNTLSVTPPYTTGQSLPNLTSDASNSLKVPTHKQVSPYNRGTSYPPPSPRTLRRCAPVPQSRNPPLMKTRHVTSVIGHPQEFSEQDHSRHEFDQDETGRRRISRVDRLDNKRYYTAGAIDDIKKQDTKDTSIHKRLSWNYGQGPPPPAREMEDSGRLFSRHKCGTKSLSNESMQSSSGVSSTSSLLRAEYEALENIDDIEGEDEEATVVDLAVSDRTSLKISPHISTTYICHDSDVTLGVCASQYITQPVDETHGSPGVKIDVAETIEPPLGGASVQITVNEGGRNHPEVASSLLRSVSSFSSSSCSSSSSFSSSSSCSSHSPSVHSQQKQQQQQTNQPRKDEQLKEILLNDASVEASDV